MIGNIISLLKEPSTKIGLGLLLSFFVPAPAVEIVSSAVLETIGGGLVLWGTLTKEGGSDGSNPIISSSR